MLDRSLYALQVDLPYPPTRRIPYNGNPTFSRHHQRSQQRLLMALNSVSLNLSADKTDSQTIILPASKFNKFIKLIQIQRKEIKAQKQQKPSFVFNEHWKYNQESINPAYQRRPNKKRLKTEPQQQEQKWMLIKKRVQANQMTIKFPQIALVKDSLKIGQTPTSSKQTTKIQFKSRSFLHKPSKGIQEMSGKDIGAIKMQHTEPMDPNLDISAWTMNEF